MTSWTFNVLHVCLARRHTNKGVRQPEVKLHAFPYCEHAAICQSLRDALSAASPSPLPHMRRNTNV